MVRQRNYFISAISSWDEIKEAQEIATNSAGASSKKYEAYTNSVAAAIEKITVAWEKFTRKLEASGAIKAVADTLAFIVKNLDTILTFASSRVMTQMFSGKGQLGSGMAKFGLGTLSFLGGSKDGRIGKWLGDMADKKTDLGDMADKKADPTTEAVDEVGRDVSKIKEILQRQKPDGKEQGAYDKEEEPNIKEQDDDDDDDNGQKPKKNTSDRLKAAGLAAAGAGITRYLTTEKEYGGEKLTAGISSGVINGLGAAFGPASSLIASFADQLITPLITKHIQKVIHGQEIARKERVEEALKNVDALEKLESAIMTGFDLINLKSEELSASEWKTWNKMVDDIQDSFAPFLDEKGGLDYQKNAEYQAKLLDAINESGTQFTSLNDVINVLTNRSGEYADALERVISAQKKMEAQEQYATTEQQRYDLLKQIQEARDILATKSFGGSLDEAQREQIEKGISSLFSELELIEKAYRKDLIETAMYKSGIGSMSALEIAGSTLEGVLRVWAKEYEDAGGDAFDALGNVSSEFRTVAMSYINESDKLKVLTNTVTARIGTMNDTFSEMFKGQVIEGFENVDTDWSVFTTNLMMSVDDIKKAGNLWWVTAKDVSSGLDELTNKFELFGSVVADLASTGLLSADNMRKMASNYPEFFIKDGEFSVDNLISNITNTLTTGSLETVFGRVAASSALTDETTFKAFQELLKDKKYDSTFSPEEITRIMNSANASEIWDLLGMEKHKKEFEDFAKIADELVQDMGMMEQLQKVITDRQIASYEKQISQLNDLKSAIADSNKARELETNLIKARQKLENAQNEKQRVYRAGIGWSYEANQESVKEAMEEVEELERQKDQENIQYQIDLAQQQLDVLNNLAKNEELENLNKTADAILVAMGLDENGTVNPAVLAMLRKFDPETAKVIEENAPAHMDRQTADAIEDLKMQYSGIEKLYSGMVSGGYQEADIKAYNAAIDKFTSDRASLVNSANYAGYMKRNPATMVPTLKGYPIEPHEYGQPVQLYPSEQEQTEYKKIEKDDYIPDYTKIANEMGLYKEAANIFNEESGVSEVTYRSGKLVVGEGKTTVGKGSNDGFYIRKNAYSGGFDVFVKSGGKIYYKYDNTGAYKDADMTSVLQSVIDSDRSSYYSNASGSMSFQGGRSMINEYGLEGIVTPKGTITSLPSRTGIIPADLTRNLYNLGAVAPNLIRYLGGSNVEAFSRSSNVEDNSTNIDTLNARFIVDEGFDFDDFLVKARQVVDTTKNN